MQLTDDQVETAHKQLDVMGIPQNNKLNRRLADAIFDRRKKNSEIFFLKRRCELLRAQRDTMLERIFVLTRKADEAHLKNKEEEPDGD